MMNTLRTLVFRLMSYRSINTGALHVLRGRHWMCDKSTCGMTTDGVKTQRMWNQVNVVQVHAKMQAGTIEVGCGQKTQGMAKLSSAHSRYNTKNTTEAMLESLEEGKIWAGAIICTMSEIQWNAIEGCRQVSMLQEGLTPKYKVTCQLEVTSRLYGPGHSGDLVGAAL